MNGLEIGIAILMNLSELAGIIVIMGIIGSIFSGGSFLMHKDLGEERSAAGALQFLKVAALVTLLTLPVALFPSIDDVWKVRVGLLKLELASPENIKSGAEEISRIAKKLECKYFGGKDCES